MSYRGLVCSFATRNRDRRPRIVTGRTGRDGRNGERGVVAGSTMQAGSSRLKPADIEGEKLEKNRGAKCERAQFENGDSRTGELRPWPGGPCTPTGRRGPAGRPLGKLARVSVGCWRWVRPLADLWGCNVSPRPRAEDGRSTECTQTSPCLAFHRHKTTRWRVKCDAGYRHGMFTSYSVPSSISITRSQYK